MWRNCSKFISPCKQVSAGSLGLLLILILSNDLSAQQWVLKFSAPSTASMLMTDPIGNYYLLGSSEMTRYSPEGDQPVTYSNLSLGTLRFADVTDPLRLLLYYPDFNTLVFLDRHLAELYSPLLLDNLGFPLAGPVCTSPSGGFWVYDKQSRRINHVGNNQEVLAKTRDLSFLTGSRQEPDFIIEKNNNLYVGLPGTGILRFDSYGGFHQILPLMTRGPFQVFQDRIIFQQDSLLCAYDLQTYQADTLFRWKKDEVLSMTIERNQLYLLTPGEVKIFRPSR